MAESGGGPRRGDRFEHAHFIIGSPRAGTARPDVCEVTAARRGSVYYRTETGMLFSKSAETFGKTVRRWLTDDR